MKKTTVDIVLSAWESSGKNIAKTARTLGVSHSKTRKLLLTAGVDIASPMTHRIMELRKQGMQIGQIAKLVGISRQTVDSHLPYERVELERWSDDERAAALTNQEVGGRSRNSVSVMRHRIRRLPLSAPHGSMHDTPLRRERLKAQLTQAELADKSGVSLPYIRDIEQGRANPSAMSLDILRALSEALGCDMKNLYETE